MTNEIVVPLAPTAEQMRKFRVHWASSVGATALCGRYNVKIKTKDLPLVTCRTCRRKAKGR